MSQRYRGKLTTRLPVHLPHTLGLGEGQRELLAGSIAAPVDLGKMRRTAQPVYRRHHLRAAPPGVRSRSLTPRQQHGRRSKQVLPSQSKRRLGHRRDDGRGLFGRNASTWASPRCQGVMTGLTFGRKFEKGALQDLRRLARRRRTPWAVRTFFGWWRSRVRRLGHVISRVEARRGQGRRPPHRPQRQGRHQDHLQDRPAKNLRAQQLFTTAIYRRLQEVALLNKGPRSSFATERRGDCESMFNIREAFSSSRASDGLSEPAHARSSERRRGTTLRRLEGGHAVLQRFTGKSTPMSTTQHDRREAPTSQARRGLTRCLNGPTGQETETCSRIQFPPRRFPRSLTADSVRDPHPQSGKPDQGPRGQRRVEASSPPPAATFSEMYLEKILRRARHRRQGADRREGPARDARKVPEDRRERSKALGPATACPG